jgi:hypothetical protein
MMRRKYWVSLAAALLLLAAADVAYWRFAADRLGAGLQSWIEARRAQGWLIDAGPVALGGWPQAASVTVANLHMRHAGKDFPGDLEWRASGIALSVAPYLPTDLHVSFKGPQHLRIGSLPDTAITGDAIDLVVPFRPSAPQSFDLHANGLNVEPSAGPWHVTAGLLNARVDLASKQGIDFDASAEAIALPPGFKWPLGANISSLSTEGTLNGPFPPAGDITAGARAWRDAGGSLDVTHLAMGWGPLGLSASATLALDDQLQPMGSGSTRVVGYAEALDRLAAGGLLTKSAATAAKAVLSLLAGTGDGGESSEVDVPLTLQFRTLSMRQVPLVRFPELDWPAR